MTRTYQNTHTTELTMYRHRPWFPKGPPLDKDTRCFASPHVCAHTRASPCCSRSILLWPLIDNWSHHRAWLCALTVLEEGREHGGVKDCGERRQISDIKTLHIWLLGLIFSLPAMRFPIGFFTEHTAELTYTRGLKKNSKKNSTKLKEQICKEWMELHVLVR